MLYFYGVKTELLNWSMRQPAQRRARKRGGGKRAGTRTATCQPQEAAAADDHARPGNFVPRPAGQRTAGLSLTSRRSWAPSSSPPGGHRWRKKAGTPGPHGTVSRCPVQVRRTSKA